MSTNYDEIDDLLNNILAEAQAAPPQAPKPPGKVPTAAPKAAVPKPAVITAAPKPTPPKVTPFDAVAALEETLEEASLPPASEILSTQEQPTSVFADSDSRTDLIRIPMPTFDAADMAAAADIRNVAQLVHLRTNRWHAKVKDRKASQDAARANDADERAFDTKKHLLAGVDEKLKAIHRTIDDARAKHYEMTAPWTTTGMDDNGRRAGARVLPNSLFFEYTAEMAKAKQAMEAALDAFEPEYPSLIEAAKQKLGKRFDIREYPATDQIRKHFDLAFDFNPIPVGQDFKGLPKQQLDALARHLTKSTETMLTNAMQDVWARLYEAVARMAERLSSPDKMFHYTLVQNVRDCSRMAKHLNILNDQRMEDIRLKIEKHLTQHDAADLREKPTLRQTVGAHAASILHDMNKLGGAK